jgi:hypothetical protein
MMGSNNTGSRTTTPSTTTSEITTDENQWIRRPPIPSIYDPTKASDPSMLSTVLTSKEVATLHDYLNLWTKNISQLLDKLKETIPGEGMIGEVHYWRDMSRILDGISEEVK